MPFEDDRGEIVGFASVTEDITDSVQGQRALQESEHRLALAERIGQLGHWSWTAETDLLEWSGEMFHIFGVDPAEFEPTMEFMNARIHPDDISIRMSTIDDVLNGRPFHEYVYRVSRPDGERTVSVTGMGPIHGENGRIVGVFGTSLDVTERVRIELELQRLNDELEQRVRRRTEELESALKAKDAFVASMSHELRTPLNSVIGFSGLLEQGLAGELTDEQRRQVHMIHASGTRLLELVNQVLELSKITSESIDIEVTRFPVAGVVDDAIAVIAPLAQLKGLDLTASGSAEAGTMTSDRGRVSQILVNLLGNGVKFTESGGVAIEVRRGGDEIAFSVTDTGPGIPAQDLPRVFEDFYQGVQQGQAKVAGTGLGPSVCRRLSESLGGTLTASSAEGVGSTFTLRLPVEVSGRAEG